jgi:hypothetical protein
MAAMPLLLAEPELLARARSSTWMTVTHRVLLLLQLEPMASSLSRLPGFQ